MKKVTFCVIFSIVCAYYASQNDADTLMLGKRRTLAGRENRKITYEHLLDERSAYYGIYYKTSSTQLWHRTGIFGKKLNPFFQSKALGYDQFITYKTKKKQSYVLLGAASVTLGSWLFYTAYGLDRTQSVLFYVRPLPLIMLSAYFVFTFSGIRLNHRGSYHLCRAVNQRNAIGESFQ